MLLHYSTCCQYAGGLWARGGGKILCQLRVWCLYSRLQSDNWQRHWRLTNRQLLLINVRWLHEILVVGEKYDRFSSLCSSVSRPKICDDFPHWGCLAVSGFWLQEALDSLGISSQSSGKQMRFSIRRFDFSLVTITVKSHFLFSCKKHS